MICLLAATNNKNSNTEIISRLYASIMQEEGMSSLYFSLTELNGFSIHDEMYNKDDSFMQAISEKYLAAATKFVFIIPEYNGSYPGVLKMFFDSIDVKKYLHGKKAALVGVATGRAGNLRGIDQLSAVLQHMQVTVMPHILPISSVRNEIVEDKHLQHSKTKEAMQKHAQAFIRF
jgi:NAD(P)H-dependent FMN reductase